MSISDFNILSSKNNTFNINNTFMAGRLTKQACDKAMFNVNEFVGKTIELGDPENNMKLIYDEAEDTWVLEAQTGITGSNGILGSTTGPSAPLQIFNETTVATDTLNTNAEYTTVKNAINGMASNSVKSYFIKIIGDTSDTSLNPSWVSSADYHIKIIKGAVWNYRPTSSSVGPNNGNLTISGPGTLNIYISTSSLSSVFTLSSNYTLFLRNLNIIYFQTSNPGFATTRSFINSSSNIDIENCFYTDTTVFGLETYFRYINTSRKEYTKYSNSTFSFSPNNISYVISLYNNLLNTTGLSILNIDNCEIAGPTNIKLANKTVSNITNTLAYFNYYTNIQDSNFTIGGRCVINNLRDFGSSTGTIGVNITTAGVSQTDNRRLLNNVVAKYISVPLSERCNMNNISIWSTDLLLSTPSTNIPVTNLNCSTLTVNSSAINFINANCNSIILSSSTIDNTLKNVVTNNLTLYTSCENHKLINSNIKSALSVQTECFDFLISNSSILNNYGTGASNFTDFTINTSKLYSLIDFVTDSSIVSNCLFSQGFTITDSGVSTIGSNRFESTVSLSGATGPLFTGNLGIPLTGPSGSIPSSIANSYIL